MKYCTPYSKTIRVGYPECCHTSFCGAEVVELEAAALAVTPEVGPDLPALTANLPVERDTIRDGMMERLATSGRASFTSLHNNLTSYILAHDLRS